MSVGIVVADAGKKIKGLIYVYIEGASASQDWVKENVLPKLHATPEEIKTILAVDFEPKVHPVSSQEELFSKTAELLQKYEGAKVYAEHLFPVEWRFFHDERLAHLELKLIEAAPEAESYFEKKEEIHQHKAWFDAFKTYKALSWRQKLYSSHVFVLPFVVQNAKKIKQSDKWQKKEIGELPYFRGFLDPEKSHYAYQRYFNAEFLEVIEDEKNTSYYQYQVDEKQYYHICLPDEKNTVYSLELDYALMRLVDEKEEDNTQIGFLIIGAKNTRYPDNQAIRKINQYGRRVYSPFFSVSRGDEEASLDIFLTPHQEITKEEQSQIRELYDSETAGVLTLRPRTAIRELLYSFFGKDIALFEPNKENQEHYLKAIIDDRMFVVCDYQLSPSEYSKLATAVRGYDLRELSDNPDAFSQGTFYRAQKALYEYLYVDNNDSTYQAPRKIGEVLDSSIYERWLDYGTIYGMTQHSLVMLTRERSMDHLYAYYYSEYLEMLLFVLTQRVKILMFSARAGECAKNMTKNDQGYIDLQKDYVVFKNQYLLPEISPQEQAVDLYRLMQKNLYVSEQKELLDDQIQSLYEIRVSLDARDQEKRSSRLNNILFAFAMLTVLTSYNDFGESLNKLSIGDFIKSHPLRSYIFIVGSLVSLSLLIYHCRNRRRK